MWKKIVATAALAAISSGAFAHTGHVMDGGASAGLLHPLLGLDHLLAAVAVGVLAARTEQRMRWMFPLSFTAVLALGYVMAGSVASALFEAGIIASLLVFSLLLFLRKLPPMQLATVAVAGFALFHGVAHGTEAPVTAGFTYIAALLAATFSLHLGGLFVGLRMSDTVVRISGVCLGGVSLALAIA